MKGGPKFSLGPFLHQALQLVIKKKNKNRMLKTIIMMTSL